MYEKFMFKKQKAKFERDLNQVAAKLEKSGNKKIKRKRLNRAALQFRLITEKLSVKITTGNPLTRMFNF